MKFLSQIFNKINPLSKEKWAETLIKVVKAEKTQNIKLPVLLFDNDVEWEFEVFYTLEDLVNTSIFSHWGGVVPNDTQLDALIVDSNGICYEIDNNCYNKDLKIGYSFPRRLEKKISIEELKEKIIKGSKEHIKFFDPDYKTSILAGIEKVKNTNSIVEIIDLVSTELDF